MTKKYLDTNIFLYPLTYEDDKADICKRILEKVVKKEIIAYTSVLCWDEFVYVLRKEKGKEIANEKGEKFLQFLNLVFLDANKNILLKAQDIMKSCNIRPRYAIHAASAIVNGIKEIISDDPDFDKIKEIKRIKLEETSKIN